MPGEWSYANLPDENQMVFACKDTDGIWTRTSISKAPLVQYMHREDIYDLIVQEVIKQVKKYRTTTEYKKQQVMHKLMKDL